LARSASVREPAKTTSQGTPSPVGALNHQPAKVAQDEDTESTTRRRNVNRHTIQPEYVQPQSHTARGEAPTTAAAPAARTRSGSQGATGAATQLATRSKPLPQDPPVSNEATKVADYPTIPPSNSQQRMPPPTRPARDAPRSISDSTGAFTSSSQAPMTHSQVTRPSTGNNPTVSGSSRADPRLPSRGSYGQPVAPTVEAAIAQGRVTQPKNGRGYNISAPIPQHGPSQSITRVPVPVRSTEPAPQAQTAHAKTHHRRSSTLGSLGEKLFGRSVSFMGAKQQGDGTRGKKERKYPPTSMKESYPIENPPRSSIDSKRSFSFGLGKKKSIDLESQQQPEEKPKRFSSLIPSTFSFRGLSGGGKEPESEPESPAPQAGDFPQPPSASRPSMQAARPSTGQGRGQYPVEQTQSRQTQLGQDGQHDQPRPARTNFSRPPQFQPAPSQVSNDVYGGTGVFNVTAGASQQQQQQPQTNAGQQQYGSSTNQTRPLYPEGFNSHDEPGWPSKQQNRAGRVLQKNNRNFTNAHDYEQGPTRHEGSSGPARKVMDYFRRRKARADTYQ
jgi:protein-serine/threonine kinase